MPSQFPKRSFIVGIHQKEKHKLPNFPTISTIPPIPTSQFLYLPCSQFTPTWHWQSSSHPLEAFETFDARLKPRGHQLRQLGQPLGLRERLLGLALGDGASKDRNGGVTKMVGLYRKILLKRMIWGFPQTRVPQFFGEWFFCGYQ